MQDKGTGTGRETGSLKDRDWGKIIIRIALLIFILFFVGRWFAGTSADEAGQPAADTAVVESASDVADAAVVESASDVADAAVVESASDVADTVRYEFRNRDLLDKHYDKHGIEMGFGSAEEYEAAASAVITNPAALHKLEQEDGDDVYYLEDTGEFVILSTDGFIRTYYIASRSYFDRQ